jgi:hypothetical protein
MNQTILNKLNEIVESQAKRGLMTAFEFANLIKEDLFPTIENALQGRYDEGWCNGRQDERDKREFNRDDESDDDDWDWNW